VAVVVLTIRYREELVHQAVVVVVQVRRTKVVLVVLHKLTD
jgi:hypothetical protein